MESEYGVAAGIAGIALVFFLIIFAIIMAALIITVIAKWKLLTKAGEDGWKAIIPIYGDMVLCKTVGVWEYYPLVILAISVFSSLFGDSMLAGTISVLSTAVSIYYAVILSISVAQSYGKDSGFGIGLMLLGVVFYPILAFGKNDYVGKKPMNDPVINSIFKDQNGAANQGGSAPAPEANVVSETPATEEAPTADTTAAEPTNESTDEVKPQGNFCPSCGAANAEGAAFCEKCGNKID